MARCQAIYIFANKCSHHLTHYVNKQPLTLCSDHQSVITNPLILIKARSSSVLKALPAKFRPKNKVEPFGIKGV